MCCAGSARARSLLDNRARGHAVSFTFWEDQTRAEHRRACANATRGTCVAGRTTQALDLIRKLALSSSDRAWRDLLQSFEAARDEWSAMEAVVKLELLLEAKGLLIEEETAYASRSAQGRSRAA